MRLVSPCSDSLSLRLPYSVKLATQRKSLTHYTKGTQSPSYPGSHCLYACGFRIYFTPLPGFFSPFPHGTGSLSVDYEYLALPDGPGRFKQGFSCPALLRSHWKEDCIFTYAAVTLSGRPFQTVQLMLSYPSFNQATSSDRSALPA